ncbi:MAG: hypothetical protein JNJ39_01570 [Blastocatellia bacterium]|nr:hypothetical protein [Blastocatellia bacterium]
MIKRIFQLNRVYREAKEKAFEATVNAIEAGTDPLFFLFFLALTILSWVAVVSTPIGPIELYEKFGFYPLIVFFVVSYFSFFLGSKLIVKPTVEELTDDTSSFALFSACKRRELRSLFSVGVSLFHTFVFLVYLISKDPKLLELL